MNIVTATKLAFNKAFDYETRSSRSEYWWYQLSYFILVIIAELAGYAIGLYEIIYYIAEVALLVPAISLAVRRLHDIGMSGWWNLIAISIIGLIPLLIWYVTPGHVGSNKFGENPLETQDKENKSNLDSKNSSFSTNPISKTNKRIDDLSLPQNYENRRNQKTQTPKGFKVIKKLK